MKKIYNVDEESKARRENGAKNALKRHNPKKYNEENPKEAETPREKGAQMAADRHKEKKVAEPVKNEAPAIFPTFGR